MTNINNSKNNVKILSLDFSIAKNIVTNTDLEKILDTSDEWISSRTGIKERRVLEGNTTSSDLGIDAAKKTLSRINFNPKDIDLIIAAASAPENIYPSVSCIIQAGIGAINAVCFDLKAACSGFIYSLDAARAFITSGLYKNILIVATDATTKFCDWEDRSTCVLFGDGASAMLLTSTENDSDIIDVNLLSDGAVGDFITLKTQGTHCPLVNDTKETEPTKPFIQMKGKDVYKFVMQVIPPKLEELLHKSNLTSKDIDYFIPHQSNQRMIDALSSRMNFEQDRVISNIEKYGNMSAASILVAIREAIDEGKMKLPATLLLSSFGAGMTAGNAIIKLDKNML